MGLLNKMGLHLGDKYIATQMQGGNMGIEITKNAPTPVKFVGLFGGLALGTALGVFRLWNPTDIVDSLLTPEKELEERVNKKIDALK